MADTSGNPTPERLAELERENARLREELAQAEERYRQEHRLLLDHIIADLPQTDEEMQQYLADSVPAEEVFRQLEAEFGPFPAGDQS